MMRTQWLYTTTFAALSGLVALSGCNEEPPAGNGTPEPGHQASSGETEDGHAHDHPTEGPHHGSLIELGDEEYHGELVHDEKAGTVTVYILDGTAKQAVPIDAQDVTINLKHDGKPEQLKLAASPEEGDPDGKSSRFVLSDPERVGHLDAEGADAQLVLTIDGKSYRGAVAHEHGEHDHQH